MWQSFSFPCRMSELCCFVQNDQSVPECLSFASSHRMSNCFVLSWMSKLFSVVLNVQLFCVVMNVQAVLCCPECSYFLSCHECPSCSLLSWMSIFSVFSWTSKLFCSLLIAPLLWVVRTVQAVLCCLKLSCSVLHSQTIRLPSNSFTVLS